MPITAILALAIAPGLFWLFIFYSKDHLEPEPRWLVMLTFLIGGIAAVPIAGAELVIIDGLRIGMFGVLVFVAPVVEEIGKYLAIRLTIFKRPEFDEPMDGIVYGVAGALGFATIENILYLERAAHDPDVFWATAIARAVLSVPGHALFSAMWGYALGWTMKINDPVKRDSIILNGILLAILFHGLFNFLAWSGTSIGFLGILLLVGFIAIAWVIVLKRIRHAIDHSPHHDNFD